MEYAKFPPRKPPSGGRGRIATGVGFIACLCLALCYRAYMRSQQTPSVPVEIALTALDGGQMSDHDRNLAVSVIRESALRCIRALQGVQGDCSMARTALAHIRNEIQK